MEKVRLHWPRDQNLGGSLFSNGSKGIQKETVEVSVLTVSSVYFWKHQFGNEFYWLELPPKAF